MRLKSKVKSERNCKTFIPTTGEGSEEIVICPLVGRDKVLTVMYFFYSFGLHLFGYNICIDRGCKGQNYGGWFVQSTVVAMSWYRKYALSFISDAALSRCHIVVISRCSSILYRVVAMSLCLDLTLSRCGDATMSRCCDIALSPSSEAGADGVNKVRNSAQANRKATSQYPDNTTSRDCTNQPSFKTDHEETPPSLGYRNNLIAF